MLLVDCCQRTVFGPLLFLMMSDISNNVTSSSIVNFWDGTRLDLDIKDVSDWNTLQDDLDTVYGWATDSSIKCNENKFHHVAFSTTQILSDHSYLLQGKFPWSLSLLWEIFVFFLLRTALFLSTFGYWTTSILLLLLLL